MDEGGSLREAFGVGEGDVWAWCMGWEAGLWEQPGEGESGIEETLRETPVNGMVWGRGREGSR